MYGILILNVTRTVVLTEQFRHELASIRGASTFSNCGYSTSQELLYQQKLALTSRTGAGRSVSIVRSRTQAKEFSMCVYSSSSIRKSWH
jgi:hypothetical protein